MRVRAVRGDDEGALGAVAGGQVRVRGDEFDEPRVPGAGRLHEWEERVLLIDDLGGGSKHAAGVVRGAGGRRGIKNRDVVAGVRELDGGGEADDSGAGDDDVAHARSSKAARIRVQ